MTRSLPVIMANNEMHEIFDSEDLKKPLARLFVYNNASPE